MSIYERLVFPKKINPFLFWFLVSAIIFILQEFFLRILGESLYLSMRLLVAIGLFGLISGGMTINHSFRKTTKKLQSIVELSDEQYTIWINAKIQDLFTYKSLGTKLMIVVLIIGGVVFSTMLIGFPFNKTLSNIVFGFSMFPLLVVIGHACYLVYGLLKFLSDIDQVPIKVPFYLNRHPSLTNLSVFYSQSSLIVLSAYIWFALTIWISPYGFTLPLLVLFAFVGFFPFAMFSWSTVQFHSLFQRIKQQHIEIINKQIQEVLKKSQSTLSKDDIEKLNSLIDIQKKVDETKGWLTTPNDIITFLITFAIPIVNFALSFWKQIVP
jgi:hypothetical protein